MLRTSVEYGSHLLVLTVDREDSTGQSSLALLATIIASLSRLDERARQAASASLLTTYNESWREYQEATGGGRFRDVTGPELDRSRFEQRLSLTSVSVTGPDTCAFGYDDDGLFWGHSVFVTSFDGAVFGDLHVELFG